MTTPITIGTTSSSSSISHQYDDIAVAVVELDAEARQQHATHVISGSHR